MQISAGIDAFVRTCLCAKDGALADAQLDYNKLSHANNSGYDIYRVVIGAGPSPSPWTGRTLILKHRGSQACEKDNLKQEAESLRRATSRLDGDPRAASMPELLGYSDQENLLVETAVRGKVIQNRIVWATVTGIGHRAAMRDMATIARWLGDFQMTIANHPPHTITPDFDAASGKLRALTSLRKEDASLLESMLESARLARPTLPMVQMHGDFSTRNVLMDGQSLAVIDWENSEMGDPLKDPAFWVISLTHMARFHAPERRISTLAVHFTQNWWNAVASMGIARPTLANLGAIHVTNYIHRYMIVYGLTQPKWQRFYRAVCQTQRQIVQHAASL